MLRAATFGLVATLILVAGSIGCHRDTENNAASENTAECSANETSNIADACTPANEPTNEPSSTPSTDNAPTTDTATGPSMDNGAANNAPVDNVAGNTPPPDVPPAEKIYVVKSGDTLWKIARAEYRDATKQDLIIKANPTINPNSLKVGTKLVIPPLPTSPEVTHPPTDGDVTGQTYTVQQGDTFWTIAQKHYGNGAKHTLIEKANPNIKSSALHAGQKIILPPDTATSGPSTSRPSHPRVTPTHRDTTDSDSPPRPHFRR